MIVEQTFMGRAPAPERRGGMWRQSWASAEEGLNVDHVDDTTIFFFLISSGVSPSDFLNGHNYAPGVSELV